MTGVLALAGRNLARNRRRTAITVTAVALSTAMVVLSVALIDGMIAGAIRNATNLTAGEVQIHAPKYVAERSFYDSIDDPAAILAAARERGIPAAARSYGYGLVARSTKSAGALFWGVDPTSEIHAFDLAQHVENGRGRYLTAEPSRGLVLGRKLARTLGAEAGSEIVVVVQAADGSLGNELFYVTGILAAVGDAVDRSAALMHAADFDELFVADGRIHEIVLNSRGSVGLGELDSFAQAAAPGTDVRTWRKVVPVLADMLAMADSVLWILGLVFCIAAGLGVMNTMLMATYERMREFGVLKAIGAAPWRIVRDVAVEALALALIGTVIGALFGLGLSQLVKVYGIDTVKLAGETSFGGVAFDSVWRAEPSISTAIRAAALMCGIALLTSLYPASLAARLRPVDAMRKV